MKYAITTLALLFTLLRWYGVSDKPLDNDDLNSYRYAMATKAEGGFPTHGLVGTRGITYGPTSALLYRMYAAVSDNPWHMRLLQTTLIALLTLLGVALTARAWRGYLAWYEPLFILLIPIFWAQGKSLWDLTIMIPLSLITMATYLNFVRDRRPEWLYATGLASSIMLNLHLMSVPLVAGLGLSLLVHHHAEIKAKPGKFIFAFALLAGPMLPYLYYLFTTPLLQGAPAQAGFFQFWDEKFVGGFKLLSSVLARRFVTKWDDGLTAVFPFIVDKLGLVVLVFAMLGLGLAYRKGVKEKTDPFLTEAGRLTLLTLALSFAQLVVARLPNSPVFYYFYYASWPAYANVLFFAWHGYAAKRWYLPLKAFYLATLVLALVGLLVANTYF